MKIRWYDMLIYRLFHWRWNKILQQKPDLRELFISWMKAFDVVDDGTKVKVIITNEKQIL